jgi:hypothetical protein
VTFGGKFAPPGCKFVSAIIFLKIRVFRFVTLKEGILSG